MIDFNEFTRELSCEYKGELYSVRDNGAIKRHIREGQKARKSDDFWTFGTKDKSNGYMIFCGERVHRIVATAFYGDHSQEYVVDHIDTNRCNNRVENLRWLTRLENILRNPITLKKIITICGSIEAFLEDPSSIGNAFSSQQNLAWLRTVSAEEGRATLERLNAWANKDTTFSSEKSSGIGEWIFNRFAKPENDIQVINNTENKKLGDSLLTRELFGSREKEEFYSQNVVSQENIVENDSCVITPLTKSITTNAAQRNWKTPTEFPMCPSESPAASLQLYFDNLRQNEIFCKNNLWEDKVVDFAWTTKNQIIVLCGKVGQDFGKPYALTLIYIEKGYFVHESYSTYFEYEGALKYFTIELGKIWEGGEVVDDYC